MSALWSQGRMVAEAGSWLVKLRLRRFLLGSRNKGRIFMKNVHLWVPNSPEPQRKFRSLPKVEAHRAILYPGGAVRIPLFAIYTTTIL